MPDIWQTSELIELQQDRRVSPPDGFWLRYFPRVVTSEKEKIYFDELPLRDRRLAPFVAPNVQGRIMARRGADVSSFKPAYLKPKHHVDPSQAIPRMPGEPWGGEMSLEARYDRIVAQNMRDERDMIERRWDHMAAMALIYGQLTITGDDYPTVTIDFKRHASLTYTLTSGARWSETTADVFEDIVVARKNAFERGMGPVTDLIFGSDAWAAFVAKDEVKELMKSENRGSTSSINMTPAVTDQPYEYLGQISGPNGGRIDLWTYSNFYEDSTGTLQPYLDPRDVVGVGRNVQGIRAFGAIMDKKAGLKAIPIFPKMWESEDPSGTFTMSQSAPLMVPGVPNNTFRIRTLS